MSKSVIYKLAASAPALLPKQRIHQPALPYPNRITASPTRGLVSIVDQLEWTQVVAGQRGINPGLEDGGADGVGVILLHTDNCTPT